MIRRAIGVALGAALLAAVPAVAQQARVQLNLSPAGQAVAKRYLGAPDPQIQAMAKQVATIMVQQKALTTAPKLDMARFTALMRQREQLQTQMMRRSNDRLLQMLGELSEPDRIALVRGLSNPTVVPAPGAK